MKMKMIAANYDGVHVPVCIHDDLKAVLDHIASVKRGRFGVITDHQSGIDNPKCIRPTVSDITFITNPKYENWLARMVAAVTAVEFLPMVNAMAPKSFQEILVKAKQQNVEDIFNEAKQAILDSLNTSQDGDGEDGYRMGHRLCYATYTAGDVSVKCHLVTEDDGTGHKRPVANGDGYMEVKSVMLPFFTVSRKVTDKGDWKETNSRVLTLMKDAIKDATGIPEWKTISLGKGNFRTLTLDKATVFGLVSEPLKTTITVPQADFFSFLTGIANFWAAVEELREVVTARR
jgi:hypothetical protein